MTSLINICRATNIKPIRLIFIFITADCAKEFVRDNKSARTNLKLKAKPDNEGISEN